MEDILTSNVFGLLRYLPPAEGLFAFISNAQALDGTRPLRFLLQPAYASTATVEYEFWPFLKESGCFGCEPDLMLTITSSTGSLVSVLIEAKYWSGKSSEAYESAANPVDQLAREWDNLCGAARSAGAVPFLIYLTQDMRYPRSEIESSISEWIEKRKGPGHGPAILWLSWRDLTRVVDPKANTILHDIHRMLVRLNLTSFLGFAVNPVEPLAWSFGRKAFRWHVSPECLRWEFSP
jgi:hypothetical protein